MAGRAVGCLRMLVAVLVFAGGSCRAHADDDGVPALALLRPYALSHVRLSPSGRYVAGLAATGALSTNEAVVCIDLATRKKNVVSVGDLRDFTWASDDRLVLAGGGLLTGGLLAVNRDGSEARVLVEAVYSQVWRNRGSWQMHTFLPDDGRHYPDILVARLDEDVWKRSALPRPSVHRLNVLTGRFTVVEKNPGSVLRWLPDATGAIRLASAVDGRKARVLFRPAAGAPWETVLEADLIDDPVDPLGFHADGKRIYVRARRGQNTAGVHLFDPRERRYGECVWRHERYDAAGLVNLRGAIGVRYDAERPAIDWLDRELAAVARRMDEALPDVVKAPRDISPDGQRLLVETFSDRDPGTYYLCERGRNRLDFLGDAAPWLKTNQLATMKPVTYRASDGLEVPAYLTLPPDRAPRNLPLVVMPHGGPWVRVSWGFDPEVQFLATHGYAVLQPNFRGSIGYGHAFERAGYRQFGLRMQDDISDGVRWAIAEGIADPRRVAIGGASFGGYAALTGLIKTPELYRCGMCFHGVTDWVRQLRATSEGAPRAALEFARMAAGDYRSEADFLAEVSPLKHIEALQAPLLLAYGGMDPVVDIEQGRLLEKALKKHGKTYELVYEPFEGHGFASLRHAAPLYEKMDAFLKQYMP